MLSFFNYFSAIKQRLASGARSLALDIVAISQFLLIAFNPRDAIGAAYRCETRLFLQSSAKTRALLAARQILENLKDNALGGCFVSALILALAFFSLPTSYVAFPLISARSQTPFCEGAKDIPSNFDWTRKRTMAANEWKERRSFALSHGHAVMLAPSDLYDEALEFSRLTALDRNGPIAKQHAPANLGPSSATDLTRCSELSARLLSEHEATPPIVFETQPRLAFATAFAPGPYFLDFKAAATRALAGRSLPSAIPRSAMESSMEMSMRSKWSAMTLCSLLIFPGIFIGVIILMETIIFLYCLTRDAARLLSHLSDPATSSRLERAGLDDQIPPAHPQSARSGSKRRL